MIKTDAKFHGGPKGKSLREILPEELVAKIEAANATSMRKRLIREEKERKEREIKADAGSFNSLMTFKFTPSDVSLIQYCLSREAHRVLKSDELLCADIYGILIYMDEQDANND